MWWILASSDDFWIDQTFAYTTWRNFSIAFVNNILNSFEVLINGDYLVYVDIFVYIAR